MDDQQNLQTRHSFSLFKVHFSREQSKPSPESGFINNFVKGFCTLWLKFWGWSVEGNWPSPEHGGRKSVLIAAPHTSNWDGLHMLAAAGYYRVKLRWIGKKSLTTGPFGGIVKWLGCVPVDRSASHDVVAQMRDAFEATDELILAVPPEGTRSKTGAWKSGFYHIANTANVPIVVSVLDYGSKTIRLSGALMPTGHYEDDFDWIKSHYDGVKGKYGDKFTIKRG